MRSVLKSLGVLYVLCFVNLKLVAQVSLFEFEEIIVQPAGDAFATNFVEFNDILLFSAKDASDIDQLWKTDGTTSGTQKLTSVTQINGINFIAHQVYNNKLYFIGVGGGSSLQIWSTDGTQTGTVLAYTIPGSDELNDFYIFKDHIYMDYNHYLAVFDMTTLTFEAFPDYYAPQSGFVEYESKLYIKFSAGTDQVLQISNNITDSVRLDIDNINSVRVFPYNNKLYFQGKRGVFGGLISFDPSTNTMMNLFPTMLSTSITSAFKVFDNALYFNADDGTSGSELWKTDGTLAGTSLVKDIESGANGSKALGYSGLNTFIIDDEFYFSAETAVSGLKMWKSDGTSTGTVMVDQLGVAPNIKGLYRMTKFNGLIFYVTEQSTDNYQLFSTNADGDVFSRYTVDSLTNLNTFHKYYYGNSLIKYDTALYFGANMSTNGYQMWKLTAVPPPLSTSEFNNVEFSVYPNPTSNVIHITNPDNSDMNYKVVNTLGQIVKLGNLSQASSTIDVSDLPSGQYDIILLNNKDKKQRNYKFIVKQ